MSVSNSCLRLPTQEEFPLTTEPLSKTCDDNPLSLLRLINTTIELFKLPISSITNLFVITFDTSRLRPRSLQQGTQAPCKGINFAPLNPRAAKNFININRS